MKTMLDRLRSNNHMLRTLTVRLWTPAFYPSEDTKFQDVLLSFLVCRGTFTLT